VDPHDFDLARVPDHLRMTFSVVDERGRRVAASKDLGELKERLRTRARESVAHVHERVANPIERSGIPSWDVDELPRTVDTKVGGNLVRGYPALVDEGASVAIRVLETQEAREREHRRGVLRLLQLAVPSTNEYVQGHLTHAEKLALARSTYSS